MLGLGLEERTPCSHCSLPWLTSCPTSACPQRFVDMGLEERTAAYVLQQNGYRTGLVGKYLNGYTSQVGAGRTG